jgi:hypothetical protein
MVGMLVVSLTWLGMACWIVCFWWMHRISSRQEAMLEELHDMTTRIERLSKAEHDLIQEVHPKVSEIKEHVENVAHAVTSDDKPAGK